MAFRPHTMRGRASFDQARAETAARTAIRGVKEGAFSSAAARRERRELIALAKTFKDKPWVFVDGKQFKVARIDENTGTVFLKVRRGKEEPFSPRVLERIN